MARQSPAPARCRCGTDFVAATGTLTFAPGTATLSPGTQLIGDLTDADDECFCLAWSKPVNEDFGGGDTATVIFLLNSPYNATPASPSKQVLTIRDDDCTIQLDVALQVSIDASIALKLGP